MNTQTQCSREGIVYKPIVLEVQGGIEPRAAAIVHRRAECVAAAEGTAVSEVKAAMLPRA